MASTLSAEAPSQKSQPIAIIDIGSNSVRLIVYESATRSAVPIFNEKVLCGLARTLTTTGQISPQSMEKAFKALSRFSAILEQMNVGRISAAATEAAREARNGAEFIIKAEQICGTKISVLEGRKEAELAAYGVISGFYQTDGIAGDLGGGSLELINICGKTVKEGGSLPLGGLRLIDIAGSDLRRAEVYIDCELEKHSWLELGKGRPFYAVGGAWRAFAKLHMAQISYPLRVPHGYTLSSDEALKFAHLMEHLSPSSLEGINEISRSRRETLPFSALILERLIKFIRPSDIIFSAFGVREGMLYALLEKKEQDKDSLLSACEAMARLSARSYRHAFELCDWTDLLFKAPGLEETRAERRLRHAACLLSDIGWRAHSEYRGVQSLHTISHAAFPGLDHPGRAFVALSVYSHHQEAEALKEASHLAKLITEREKKHVRIIAAALRLAYIISASMDGVIPNTPLDCQGEDLVLSLPHPYETLKGLKLVNHLSKLAGLLDLNPRIETA